MEIILEALHLSHDKLIWTVNCLDSATPLSAAAGDPNRTAEIAYCVVAGEMDPEELIEIVIGELCR
jgi:hypothetical protein